MEVRLWNQESENSFMRRKSKPWDLYIAGATKDEAQKENTYRIAERILDTNQKGRRWKENSITSKKPKPRFAVPRDFLELRLNNDV